MDQRTYMVIGAHPDDADVTFGGTAILLRELGHQVVFVSLTDGSAGHQTMGRKELAERRYAETQEVARFLGITYIVMDCVDGELVADLPTRHKLISLIREVRPDVIIAPRPNDYHPDHRATAQLVQDCSYLLAVPAVCPEVERLDRMPCIFYNHDNFAKPADFTPDLVIDITSVIDRKMESFSHHVSQVFEWLPFIGQMSETIPTSNEERIEFLKRRWGDTGGVSRFLPLLKDPDARFVEALERCEYGAGVTPEIARSLFPFALVNFE